MSKIIEIDTQQDISQKDIIKKINEIIKAVNEINRQLYWMNED